MCKGALYGRRCDMRFYECIHGVCISCPTERMYILGMRFFFTMKQVGFCVSVYYVLNEKLSNILMKIINACSVYSYTQEKCTGC